MRLIRETLAEHEKEALTAVQDTAEEVRRLAEGIEELRRQTVSSPRMDGMPRGGGQDDAMSARISRLEDWEKKLRAARRGLARAKRAARLAIARLPAQQRIFYGAYYIDGEKMGTACTLARISARTGSRYAQMVEGKE